MFIFMHDGAPCHRSKAVKDFEEIQMLNYPGKSPDLNRIGNLWCNLKNNTVKKQPSSAIELFKS